MTIPGGSSLAGLSAADGESLAAGAVRSAELPGVAGLSVFGSESARPGVSATTVSSLAVEVTAGDFMGLGNVTADSFDPPDAGLAGAAPADDDLPVPPLPLPDDGAFGLVVREAARRVAEAGGGVAPEADDLPEVEDSDCVFARRSEASADFDGEPRASAAVRSEDLSFPSGVSPFLLSDSGLGSTLFRTTVSG